jgi:DNA-binding MarR family transcriptional regulator
MGNEGAGIQAIQTQISDMDVQDLPPLLDELQKGLCSKNRLEVLNYLYHNGTSTFHEMHKGESMYQSTLHNNLMKLIDIGLVEREKGPKDKVYKYCLTSFAASFIRFVYDYEA